MESANASRTALWAEVSSSHGRAGEEAIRAYIRNQEKEDQRLEQINLWR